MLDSPQQAKTPATTAAPVHVRISRLVKQFGEMQKMMKKMGMAGKKGGKRGGFGLPGMGNLAALRGGGMPDMAELEQMMGGAKPPK